MSAKVTPVASAPGAGLTLRSEKPRVSEVPGRKPPAQDPADLRLVIEEDQDTGSFVYKTLDRRTGEVVQQLPSEEVLRLKRGDNYEAGSVIKTKA